MDPKQRAALEDAAVQRAEDDWNRTGEPVDETQHAFSDNYSWTDEEGRLRCGRYSQRVRGSCDQILDERGECPRQADHGWSDES